jgi:thiol-disulfide isomerase/thioredoxin
MKKIILFLLGFGHVCIQAQDIAVVKIEELRKIYMRPGDTTYVVNFFATWCGPCIQEMPVLNKFGADHKASNIRLIFVSLDNSRYLKKLPSFVRKLKLTAPVYLLNESSDFSWLPEIDKRWQGSIPATMVVNSTRHVKAFFETPLEEGQLEYYLKRLGL